MAEIKSAFPLQHQLPIAALEQDIEHRFSGLRRLLEATDRINPRVLLDEAFRQIDEACRKVMPYDRIEFALFEDDDKTLVRRWKDGAGLAATDGIGTADRERCGGLLAEVLAEGKPRIVSDLAACGPSGSAFLREAANAGMKSSLVCALRVSEKPVGFVFLFNAGASTYEAQHAEILSQMTPPLSAIIAKGRLYEMVIQAQLESERLLRNVLPEPIVKRLKAGEQIIADGISEATVVFVDIVNFVKLSASMSPTAVVIVLNRIFSAFDALCEQYRVEKIKTIGDAYMLATGVPRPFPEHVVVAAKIALDMQELAKRLGMREERSLSFRIGIHTGPVVAGVIGTRKFSYDIWGDTVNIASRMEAHGVPGRIHVTREVHERLKEDFDFEPRGRIRLKGLGHMETFFLNAPKIGKTYRSMIGSMLDSRSVSEDSERRRAADDQEPISR